nr:hypothetical protein [uncultured Oscillibacter sp.]
MEPISGTIHSPAPAGVREPSAVQAPRQEEPRTAPAAPARDQYVPEEAHTPCGLYWMGRDEDGSPKIFFDDPAPKAAEDLPEDAESRPPEVPEAPAPGRDAEKCTCDTGRVDRDIRRLKERREQLEGRLRTETDETRARELERQLAQVDRELAQKDNDTYRRQHADFS